LAGKTRTRPRIGDWELTAVSFVDDLEWPLKVILVVTYISSL